MKWPQVVMIVLYTISLVENIRKHGEPETGRHNALSALLGVAFGVTVLYFGGFWK